MQTSSLPPVLATGYVRLETPPGGSLPEPLLFPISPTQSQRNFQTPSAERLGVA